MGINAGIIIGIAVIRINAGNSANGIATENDAHRGSRFARLPLDPEQDLSRVNVIDKKRPFCSFSIVSSPKPPNQQTDDNCSDLKSRNNGNLENLENLGNLLCGKVEGVSTVEAGKKVPNVPEVPIINQ